MRNPNWLKNAYKTTEVSWTRTQSEIYKMLGDLGIYEIRFTNMREKFAIEFLITVVENEKPRAVRIVIPLKSQNDDEKKRTSELNIIHRVLLNHLKAKFVAIYMGLTEFDQEFMAHLIILDKNGNSTTIGERLLPEYKQNLESGKGGNFKLLGDGE